MGISLKTHKMLWAHSGNICAFPGCRKPLVEDISETDDHSVVGEEAHIVAREPDGPRGNSTLTPEERDKYNNLILMCGKDHKIIDDFPDKYPVEMLHEYKKKHEEWVKQTLHPDPIKQREDIVYASYIDEFLRLLDVENYKGWTSFLMSGDHPKLDTGCYNALRELIEYIVSRVWFHRYPQLEHALVNLKNVLNDFLKVFDEHAKEVHNGEQLWTEKFYQLDEWNPELYELLHEKYKYHVFLIEDMVMELTRAANYVFDMIRQYLIPGFRIKEGVLLVEAGPFFDMSWRTYRAEYKPDERTEMPYPGLRKFMEIRSSRSFCWGQGVSEDYFHPLH